MKHCFHAILFALGLQLFAGFSGAQTLTPDTALANGSVGVVTNLQGTLSVAKPGSGTRLLEVNATVKEGDVLSTGAGTFARLKMVDGAELILRPNSRAELTRYVYKPSIPATDSALITLIQGGLRSLTGLLGKRNPQQVTLKTSTATIGIRGTEVGLLQCNDDCAEQTPPGMPQIENGTHVEVTSGAVEFETAGGRMILRRGDFAWSRNANSPPQQVPRNRAARQDVPPSIRQNRFPPGQASAPPLPRDTDPSTGLLSSGSGDLPGPNGSELGAQLSDLPPTSAGPSDSPPPFGGTVLPSFGPTRSASPTGGGRTAISPN